MVCSAISVFLTSDFKYQTMPRGTKLSDFEQGQIKALYDRGVSMREIGRKINRSLCVIQNFLKNPENYGTNNHHGAKRKLDPRTEARISRAASNSSMSLMDLRALVNGNVSKTTIWRTLKRNKNIQFEKQIQIPKLTKRHKEARVDFAIKNMFTNWERVNLVFI